jgi:hypothetical protein
MGGDEMNTEETRRAAQVMIDVANGKKRQRRWDTNPKGEWLDCEQNEGWNWEAFEYRIKPKPLEGWVNVYAESWPFYPLYAFTQPSKMQIAKPDPTAFDASKCARWKNNLTPAGPRFEDAIAQWKCGPRPRRSDFQLN